MIPTTIASSSESAQGRWGVDPYSGWLAAIRDLRADWLDGARPAAGELQSYLASVPTDQQPEALEDLVAEHLRLSWEAGCGQLLEQYSLPNLPTELIEDEFLARYSVPFGDTPLPEEYAGRFGSGEVLARLQQRQLAGGRYVKLRRLGIGGMADVYEAYDHHLRRRVAIKQPRLPVTDAEVLRRFTAEARHTAALSHPGIVTVHDYHEALGEPDAVPLLVMRLASKETLRDRIRDYHRPPADRSAGQQRALARELLGCLVSACNAVAYAHAHGVRHGDLKPDNIAVGQFGETVVLDWGKVAGTPEYMAPEQADGVTDERTDVFGLGAILYEILAGRSPHAWPEGCQPADWPQRVRAAQFARPTRFNSQAPQALEAVCLRALNREPGGRYQSVAELAEQLRCYGAGEAVAGEQALARWWRKLCG